MKKIIQIILMAVVMFTFFFTTVNATGNKESEEVLKGESTGTLLKLKTHESETIEDFKKEYGSDTYGVTAYILDKIRFLSIPLAFIGLAFSGIYQYVIGLKKMDVRDKGFNSMIAIITLLVICQILPLVFAIVVTSAGKQ